MGTMNADVALPQDCKEIASKRPDICKDATDDYDSRFALSYLQSFQKA